MQRLEGSVCTDVIINSITHVWIIVWMTSNSSLEYTNNSSNYNIFDKIIVGLCS